MAVSGVIMEQNLHNLFILYGVMTGICIPLHIMRIVRYPDSFEANADQEEENHEL